MRIELTYQAWKACVLPLNYARIFILLNQNFMGRAGFEPAKRFASDLQSDLVDHLSTYPNFSEGHEPI